MNMKTAQDLQIQWAGGRDVWPQVPHQDGFISMQTKVKDHSSSSSSGSSYEWPEIVRESTLFGFGAYYPRGQTLPNEMNEKQHALLRNDIENSLMPYSDMTKYWEAASIWQDGSSEQGFILAFREQENEGLELSIALARKYNQGAIYRFRLEQEKEGDRTSSRLMRDTIPVLDEGTEGRVEVEIDDAAVDLWPVL